MGVSGMPAFEVLPTPVSQSKCKNQRRVMGKAGVKYSGQAGAVSSPPQPRYSRVGVWVTLERGASVVWLAGSAGHRGAVAHSSPSGRRCWPRERIVAGRTADQAQAVTKD